MTVFIEELEALKEIYQELQYERVSENRLKAEYPCSVNIKDFKVTIENGEKEVTVSHLPPITFSLELSETSLLSFCLTCRWLSCSQINILFVKLTEITHQSDSNDGLLWNMFQFLENESLPILFDILDEFIRIDVKTNFLDGNELFDELQQFDRRQCGVEFSNGIFECCSCLVPKRGANSIRLRRCGHVVCLECAVGYFTAEIRSGHLELKCLECSEEVNNDEVRGILDKETFERWDRLLLNQFINSTGNFTECPNCRTAVLTENDKFGICNCGLTFCVKCRKTYHGDGFCPFEIDADDNHSEDNDDEDKDNQDEREVEMDFYLSRRRAQKTLMKFKQELRKTILCCPKCGEGIQKISGCNKLCCPRCLCFFCYVCNKILDKEKPYSHFGMVAQCPLFR